MALAGKGPTMIWSMFLIWFVTAIFLGLRIYTRVAIMRNLGWDDCLLSIGSILLFLFALFTTIASVHGLGQHMTDLAIGDLVETLKWTSVAQSVAIFGSGIIKASLCAFLLRLVVVKWHKISLIVPAAIVLFLSTLTALGIWVQYTPSRAVFDPRVAKVTNFNQTTLSLVDASFLIASDFFYAAFPWMFIWKLNMKLKERITIAAGLSLGVLAGACGIIRTVQLNNLASTDFTFDLCDAIIWTSAEMAITVICSTIPAIFPLYRAIRGGSTANSRTYGHELQGSHAHGIHMSSQETRSRDLTGRKKTLHSTTVMATENKSDESILGSTRRADNGVIQRTQEYTVEYSQRT